jgi:hypothetical protein
MFRAGSLVWARSTPPQAALARTIGAAPMAHAAGGTSRTYWPCRCRPERHLSATRHAATRVGNRSPGGVPETVPLSQVRREHASGRDTERGVAGRRVRQGRCSVHLPSLIVTIVTKLATHDTRSSDSWGAPVPVSAPGQPPAGGDGCRRQRDCGVGGAAGRRRIKTGVVLKFG